MKRHPRRSDEEWLNIIKECRIEQLLPWSDFIKERCSGVTDTETIRPENREDLPV